MRRGFSAVLVAVVLVVSGVAPAAAQDTGNSAHERLLVVAGEGRVHAQPDIALITLGVVSEAPAAAGALSANSKAMNKILAALKQGGMQPADLQTSGFSVDPVYSEPPRNSDGSQPFTPKITGYRVSNNLTLRIRDLKRVGAILDQVVTLGANSISGPTFTVADPTPLEDRARRAAVRDALRKGALYVRAAGVTLGPLQRIEETFVRPPQPMAPGVMMKMDAAAAPPPIEGGELTFEAGVTVSWRLGE